MKKNSLLLFASFASLVIFLLLPSCIPNTPGGNPQPQCYRYDVTYDSINRSYDTARVVVPCVDTNNIIHCDTIIVDTISLQPVYVWVCDTVVQNPNDTLGCHYVFSHNEMRPSSFIRLINCR